jgi:hypothetical protein
MKLSRLLQWIAWKEQSHIWRKAMPEISLFFGIKVTMYYDDHNPPHFHADYNGHKARGCLSL